MTKEDMVILIKAFEVNFKLVKAFNMLTDLADFYGSGVFKDLEDLELVIAKYSVEELWKDVKGCEPLGYFILRDSSMIPEAKAEYLLGARFLKENEE